MTVNLEQINYGDQNYITKLENNRAIIEGALNELYGYLSGGQTGGGGAVPLGLQEIFDRRGLIGIASYDFEEGTLSGPDYNFTVAPGAYWYPGAFYHKDTGTALSMAGKDTGTYCVNLDATGAPFLGTSPDNTTTRQFSWDNGTKAISGKALYTGVNILLDGDDYADMLTSAVKGKSFEKAADRLEEMEAEIDIFGGFYAQDLPHSGLNFKYQAGKVRNDSTITDTPAGQVALTDDQTNYVEVNPADGVVSANTAGFASGQIPLYQVVTASGAIDTVDDKRTPAIAGTGGGGGGHTQGTDQGTTASTFTIDTDASGSPTDRAGIEVENGDDPNAHLKFNRDTDRWQYSEDGGSTWKNLGDLDPDFGAQVLTQFISKEDPDQVLEDLARGSSADYEDLDLSSYVTAPQGVEAVALLVYFWDSAPGSAVNVLFKKKGSASNPIKGFTVWSGETDPGLRVIPVDDDGGCQFFVNASGADTANLRIFLLGYHKKVTGVGTQKMTLTFSGNEVAANTTQLFNLTGFIKRGIAYAIKVEETGGAVTDPYDLGLYSKDTCGGGSAPEVTDADKLFIAKGIDPTDNGRVYENFLGGWRLEDEDDTDELHLKIFNSDTTNSAFFTISLVLERFA